MLTIFSLLSCAGGKCHKRVAVTYELYRDNPDDL